MANGRVQICTVKAIHYYIMPIHLLFGVTGWISTLTFLLSGSCVESVMGQSTTAPSTDHGFGPAPGQSGRFVDRPAVRK